MAQQELFHLPEKKNVLPRLVRNFMEAESAAGMVMILFGLLALVIANSGFADSYKAFIYTPIGFSMGELTATESLKDWVKDILMVLFFFVIGMELKREMKEGFLAERGQIMLPLVAAAGGMAVPALVYLFINSEAPQNHHGWAISSATDIAFALAVLVLVGRGIPPAVKIFLLAIAIFDDLGAILVIAFFYNTALSVAPLLLSLIGLSLLYFLNRANIDSFSPYMIVGIFLWFCFYNSGVHTTIAGVLVGMAIPMRSEINPQYSPLNTAMHFLHTWVSFLVLPIFAFTSAGVSFKGMDVSTLLDPLPLGIALGLFFGKQIGIFGSTWLLIKTGLAAMPKGANWLYIYGVSVIAGIGFTMSLFIGLLAFDDELSHDLVKLGVISGSLLSTLWGAVVMKAALARSGAHKDASE